jgi:hypothetical protein
MLFPQVTLGPSIVSLNTNKSSSSSSSSTMWFPQVTQLGHLITKSSEFARQGEENMIVVSCLRQVEEEGMIVAWCHRLGFRV